MTRTAIVLALARRERDLELLAGFLDRVGYETETATGFDEFDRLLDEIAADEVGLGVFDVDGFTEAIWNRCGRVSDRGVPVLVLTGDRPDHVRQAALSHGADSILEKPVRKAELESTIHTLLDR